MCRLTAEQAGGRNVCAFLDMIRWSEIGPALLAKSDDGYNVLVGATPAKPLLFTSYADHPHVLNTQLKSSAAGGYQILARYWPYYRDMLGLVDFSPESQDRYAIQQLRERGAFKLVQAGHLVAAVAHVSSIWASLPGAGYLQRENSITDLRAAYVAAGGLIA